MNAGSDEGGPGPARRTSMERWGGNSLRTADPGDAPVTVERMAVLAHELGNLLDGSLRSLGLVCDALEDGVPNGSQPGELAEIRQRLATVYSALERMAALVHAALQGGTGLGATGPVVGREVTLAEAIEHACSMVQSAASAAQVDVRLDIADSLRQIGAGALYSVVVNGLRNAVESIAEAGGRGTVRLVARKGRGTGNTEQVEIEIMDDGVGLPKGQPPSKPFEFGFTTRRGGSGVGLALSRQLVLEMGGTIELLPRHDLRDRRRPGAVLRVRCPVASRRDGPVFG